MKSSISKRAQNRQLYLNNDYFFKDARSAFEAFLLYIKDILKVERIIIPNYVGYSINEGSGIFDPIAKTGMNYSFYKMDNALTIDQYNLFNEVDKSLKKTAVLLVNYFGFVDNNFNQIVDRLKSKKILIIEDGAHSLLTNSFGNNHQVDATFFSLHKILPVFNGGLLRISNVHKNYFDKINFINDAFDYKEYYSYDMFSIALIRKRNYLFIEKYIEEINSSSILKLKKNLPDCTYPQSFPLIIKKGNRDEIYKLMNAKGYGVVSLYHTMISPLQEDQTTFAFKLSKHILNLPVHQDVDIDLIKNMINELVYICDNMDE